MPTISNSTSNAPSGHRIRRICGALIGALAAAAALSTPTVAAAASGPPPLPYRQPLVAVGKGTVTGELPFCFNGAPGPCGWIVEGTHRGTPIRSGTFFAAIDDGNAATSRRCVPATYSGLLYESPADEIAHAAEGRVCPDGAGGHVFTGRFHIAAGTGRFREVSSGSGRVLVTITAQGRATLTLAGHIRTN